MVQCIVYKDLRTAENGKLLIKSRNKNFDIEIRKDQMVIDELLHNPPFSIHLIYKGNSPKERLRVCITHDKIEDSTFMMVSLNNLMEPDAKSLKIGKLISSNAIAAEDDQRLKIEVRAEEMSRDIHNIEFNLLVGLQTYLSEISAERIAMG